MAATFFAVHPEPVEHIHIDETKYELMRTAILETLKVYGSLGLLELSALVEERLKGTFDGPISWYFTTVELDLEARGEIRRVPNSRPQVIEIA
jgi:hypothetical protein